MGNPREDLEAAIRANPDDPQGWQVYGDWLSEQGDARGEAIAICERLRRERMSASERATLYRKYTELCDPSRWLEGLPEGLLSAERDEDEDEDEPGDERAPLSDLEWQHGFVVGATLSFEEDLEGIEAFHALPAARLLSSLTVQRCTERNVASLLDCGLLRSLKVLRFAQTDPSALQTLFPQLPEGLEALHLEYNEPTDSPWIEALASAGNLRGLRVLTVENHQISAEDAEILARSEILGKLVALDLQGNEIGARGARALARSSTLGRLERLYLSGNGIGDEGIAALVDSPALQGLQVLEVSGNDLTDEGARALAYSALFSLTALDLEQNEVTDEGLQALLGSPVLRGLTTLRLNCNELSDRYDGGDYPYDPVVFSSLPRLAEVTLGKERDKMQRRTLWKARDRRNFYVDSWE